MRDLYMKRWKITFDDGGVTYVQAATLNHARKEAANLGHLYRGRGIASIEAV